MHSDLSNGVNCFMDSKQLYKCKSPKSYPHLMEKWLILQLDISQTNYKSIKRPTNYNILDFLGGI